MSRPATLAEAAERMRDGAPREKAVPEFLDSFYLASDADLRAAMLAQDPVRTGDAQLDALIGAVCEYLSKRYQLPAVPAWASLPQRFLDQPWFTCAGADDGMREYLAFSSPAEFARRNIFTEGLPLRRASQTAAAGNTLPSDPGANDTKAADELSVGPARAGRGS